MARVVRTMSATMLPTAGCETCNTGWGPSDIARDLAKQHAKDTGHAVIVETVTRDLYRLEA